MIPDSKQPEHCEHECVCMGYANRSEIIKDLACSKKKCEHDTRARHHNPAKNVSLTAIEIALRKEECPSENVQWAIEHLNRYQERIGVHDAATRADERENLLRELLDISHGVWNLKDMQDRIRALRGSTPLPEDTGKDGE